MRTQSRVKNSNVAGLGTDSQRAIRDYEGDEGLLDYIRQKENQNTDNRASCSVYETKVAKLREQVNGCDLALTTIQTQKGALINELMKFSKNLEKLQEDCGGTMKQLQESNSKEKLDNLAFSSTLDSKGHGKTKTSYLYRNLQVNLNEIGSNDFGGFFKCFLAEQKDAIHTGQNRFKLQFTFDNSSGFKGNQNRGAQGQAGQMITIDEVELLGSAEMFDNNSAMGTLRKLEEDGLNDKHKRSLSQKYMGRANAGGVRSQSQVVLENHVMSKSCANLPVIDEYRGQRRPSRPKKNKHSDVSLKRWGHRDQDSNGNARIEEQEFEIQK